MTSITHTHTHKAAVPRLIHSVKNIQKISLPLTNVPTPFPESTKKINLNPWHRVVRKSKIIAENVEPGSNFHTEW
jgi:hypothetical protein